MIIRLAERNLKTKYGLFREILYYDGLKESIALVMGDVQGSSDLLCRIHSSCLSAHAFNSIECDCREQMEIAQQLIQQANKGVILWLEHEGRGNGHLALIWAARLAQEQNLTQTEVYKKMGFGGDARAFVRAAEILTELGVLSVVLITNNPTKAEALRQNGIVVAGSQPALIESQDNPLLQKHYADKKEHGHFLDLP